MKKRTLLSFVSPLVLLAMMTGVADRGLAQAPSIVTPPVSRAIPQGGTGEFTVTTSGALPITYTWLWFRNNKPPTLYYQATLNSTNCTITLTNVQPADSGYFNLDMQNAFGSGPGKQVAVAVISSGMATNGFVLTVYGLTNSVWKVNVNTNLGHSDWFTLTNFSLPKVPVPTFQFIDLEATNLNRFYQVIPTVF